MRVGSVTKFIFSVSAAIAAAVSREIGFLMILLAAVLTAFITWGGSFREVLKVAKIAFWFFILVFLLHLFSGSGQVLFEIWFLDATFNGIAAGLLYGLKLIAFVYSAYIIFFRVDPIELINPIERVIRYFGSAGRIISSFLISFSLALRFLPDLSSQARTNMMAFRSRGFDFRGGIIKRINTAGMLLISIFVSTFKKAESVSIALELKGYSLRYRRAKFSAPGIGFFDILVIVATISILFAGWQSR